MGPTPVSKDCICHTMLSTESPPGSVAKETSGKLLLVGGELTSPHCMSELSPPSLVLALTLGSFTCTEVLERSMDALPWLFPICDHEWYSHKYTQASEFLVTSTGGDQLNPRIHHPCGGGGSMSLTTGHKKSEGCRTVETLCLITSTCRI